AFSRTGRWDISAVRIGVAHARNSDRSGMARRTLRDQPAARISGVHARHDTARADVPLTWRGSSSPAGGRTATSTHLSVSASHSVDAVTAWHSLRSGTIAR